MKYRPILIGVSAGGIVGVIAFFISALGLIFNEIEALRPVLAPGVERILVPYFPCDWCSDAEFIILAAATNALPFAILGGAITSIISLKKIYLNLVLKILFIIIVLFIFFWWTGILYIFTIFDWLPYI